MTLFGTYRSAPSANWWEFVCRSAIGIQDNVLYTAAVFYSSAIAFLFSILIKRLVLPEIVGAFAFVAAILGLFHTANSTIRSGMERIIPQYLGQGDRESAKNIASLSFSFLLLVCISGSLAMTLAGCYFKGDGYQFYAFLACGFIFITDSVATFLSVLLKSHNLIKKTAWVFVIRATVLNACFYSMVIAFHDPGYFAGYMVGGIASFLATVYFAHKSNILFELQLQWTSPHMLIKSPLAKELFHIGFALMFYAMIFELFLSTGTYFVKGLSGNTMLAFYTFAVSGVTSTVALLTAFIGSFAPRLYAGFAAGDTQERILDKITLLALALSYSLAYIVFTRAEFAVMLILPNYAQSIPLIQICAFMVIPFAQYNISYIIAVGRGKITTLIFGMLTLLAINAALCWTFSRYFDVKGIAWATVTAVFLAYGFVSSSMAKSYRLWHLTPWCSLLLALNVLIDLRIGRMLADATCLLISATLFYFLTRCGHNLSEADSTP